MFPWPEKTLKQRHKSLQCGFGVGPKKAGYYNQDVGMHFFLMWSLWKNKTVDKKSFIPDSAKNKLI